MLNARIVALYAAHVDRMAAELLLVAWWTAAKNRDSVLNWWHQVRDCEAQESLAAFKLVGRHQVPTHVDRMALALQEVRG